MINWQSEKISSRDNSLLKRIRTLQQVGAKGQKARQTHQETWIEGIHLIQAWQGDPALHTLITTKQGLKDSEILLAIEEHLLACANTRLIELDDEIWGSIAELEHAPQIAGLLSLGELNPTINISSDVLILDHIQDAGNLGTILRTALASEFKMIICTPGCAHAWSSKVLRSAMGAHRFLHINENWSVNQILKKIKVPLLAATGQGSSSLFKIGNTLKNPCAWIFGNEGSGISEELLASAELISIPHNSQIESLNVASAAAICLFETMRVRGSEN